MTPRTINFALAGDGIYVESCDVDDPENVVCDAIKLNKRRNYVALMYVNYECDAWLCERTWNDVIHRVRLSPKDFEKVVNMVMGISTPEDFTMVWEYLSGL